MRQVMAHLQIPIPRYDRFRDPIFAHATLLHPLEMHTTTRPALEPPVIDDKPPLDDKKIATKTDHLPSSNNETTQSTNKGDKKMTVMCSDDVTVTVLEGNIISSDRQDVAINEHCNNSVLDNSTNSKASKKGINEEILSSKRKTDSVISCSQLEANSNTTNPETNVDIDKKETIVINAIDVKEKIKPNRSRSSSPEIQIVAVVVKNNDSKKIFQARDHIIQSFSSQSKYVVGVSGSSITAHEIKEENIKKEVQGKVSIGVSDSTLSGGIKLSHNVFSRSIMNGFAPAGTDPTNSFGAGLCHYCRAQRGSYRCLYYVRHVPVFVNCTGDRDRTPVCECCERLGIIGTSTKRRNSSSKDKLECDDKECDESSESQEKKDDDQNSEDNLPAENSASSSVLTNPGWFGKGYRKRMKKKRLT